MALCPTCWAEMEIEDYDPTCVPKGTFVCPNDCKVQSYSSHCWLCEKGKKDPFAITFNVPGYENCRRADNPENGYECRYCHCDLRAWRRRYLELQNQAAYNQCPF